LRGGGCRPTDDTLSLSADPFFRLARVGLIVSDVSEDLQNAETARGRVDQLLQLGQIRPEVARFCMDVIDGLERRLSRVLAGDQAVQFVTHLAMAMERARADAQVETDVTALEAELASEREALKLAREVVESAKKGLGIELGKAEGLFLALHLAVVLKSDMSGSAG